MSHFARLDSNNFVINVIFLQDCDFIKNTNDEETEGIKYLKNIFGENSRWVQTSYNTYMGGHKLNKTPLRGKYAEIGDVYDEITDLFIPPKPYQSWIFDKNTCSWVPPIEKPNDNKWYYWNESTLSWVCD